MSLRISEIFYSLQGETKTVGLPTVFVRLTGCPLRCHYCDTTYAFKGGETLSLETVLSRVAAYNPRFVTVTGGEPLAQPHCRDLLTLLCDMGYQVSLETSGAILIEHIDPRVMIVMDLKTPASGEMDKNCWENIPLIKKSDQIKFVIADRHDYEWSKEILFHYALAERCECLFSPSYQVCDLADLAGWILADNLPVRMQVQLHKVIWGDVAGV